MVAYLLDTNVVSEMRRTDRADANVRNWFEATDPGVLYCSSVTVLELKIGALRALRKDPRQGAALQEWLDTKVLPSFAGKVLAVDMEVALRCASLHVPDPRSDHDAFIAATALVHDLTIVTRNTRDFDGTGVKLLNPWEAET